MGRCSVPTSWLVLTSFSLVLPDGSIRTIDPFVRVKSGDIPVLRLHTREVLR